MVVRLLTKVTPEIMLVGFMRSKFMKSARVFHHHCVRPQIWSFYFDICMLVMAKRRQGKLDKYKQISSDPQNGLFLHFMTKATFFFEHILYILYNMYITPSWYTLTHWNLSSTFNDSATRGHSAIKWDFLRTVYYLFHVKEPKTKGHLSYIGTLSLG